MHEVGQIVQGKERLDGRCAVVADNRDGVPGGVADGQQFGGSGGERGRGDSIDLGAA
jgi:hypothetical protein